MQTSDLCSPLRPRREGPPCVAKLRELRPLDREDFLRIVDMEIELVKELFNAQQHDIQIRHEIYRGIVDRIAKLVRQIINFNFRRMRKTARGSAG